MPQNLFGFELSQGLRWVIAFAILLVLLALLGLFLRRITGGRLRTRGQGGRTRQPRLGVVDIHDLDRQRQLVLIRRDNVEHLVMIGGASDVVIESNIVRGSSGSSGRVAAQAQAEFALPERPLAVDTTIPPEALRQDLGEEPRRAPPPVAPVPVPEQLPPLPHRVATPARTEPPSQAQVAASTAGPAVAAAVGVTQAPNFTRAPAPAPSASSGELDDMARQLEEALKRPFSAVRPASLPAEPPTAAPPPPPPAVAPELPKPQPVPAARTPELKPAAAPPPPPPPAPVPPAPAAAPPPPAQVPTPPLAPPPVFGRPTGIPADVAAELEMALGLKPEPAPSRAPQPAAPPAPAVQVPPRAVTEARPASSPPPARPPEPAAPAAPKEAQAPKSKVEERLDQAIEDRPEPPRDAARQAATPEPKRAEAGPAEARPAEAKPAEPKPAEPRPAEVKPAEAKPAEPKAEAKPAEPEQPAKPTQIDPFSVDAIEAEFARLLGRDPKSKS